jgi:transforming growth factor-beta-induced protein
VEIAAGVNATGEFDYLLGAATCDFFNGAVVALLTGQDKHTLFAPTDAAFRNLLGVAQPEQGADEPKGEVFPCVAFESEPLVLLDILTYHVTDGRRFSNSVFNRKNPKMIEMLNEQYVIANPDLTLSDNAGQTIGLPSLGLVNINASNGVIHVIDTVLLPTAP